MNGTFLLQERESTKTGKDPIELREMDSGRQPELTNLSKTTTSFLDLRRHWCSTWENLQGETKLTGSCMNLGWRVLQGSEPAEMT